MNRVSLQLWLTPRCFFDLGDYILLILLACTLLSHQSWDADAIDTDLAAIAAAELEILNANEPTTIFCVNGARRVVRRIQGVLH